MARVWAFEPVPFIHDMLRANIRLNQIDNLETIQAAVADFNGESTFFITRTSTGIPTDSSSCAGFRSQVEAMRLPTLTLDEHMRRHQIARLDLLKIDAEAAEAKVLRGALETIQRDRPLLICEILENVDHAYLQKTLHALDYLFYHITPERLVPQPRLQGSLNVQQRNYLFVPAHAIGRLTSICAKAGIAGAA